MIGNLRYFLTVSLLLHASSSFAIEFQHSNNPLGLPAPQDASKPGAIMLHGGGPIAGDVFNRFIELADGKNARIVFVPSAGFRRGDFNSDEDFLRAVTRRYSSWARLAERGDIQQINFLFTDDPADADSATFTKPLEEATGVWFSGGLQPRLNYRFVKKFPEQSRFQIELRRVLERGGVVGGTSAGMAALPEIMTMWQDRAATNRPATVVAAHGMGLLNHAIVEQHFDARGGRLERFTGLLRDTKRLDDLAGRAGAGANMMGLGVEERTALVAQGNHLQVLGTGRAHVFVRSSDARTIVWHQLSAGEAANIHQDAPPWEAVKFEAIAAKK